MSECIGLCLYEKELGGVGGDGPRKALSQRKKRRLSHVLRCQAAWPGLSPSSFANQIIMRTKVTQMGHRESTGPCPGGSASGPHPGLSGNGPPCGKKREPPHRVGAGPVPHREPFVPEKGLADFQAQPTCSHPAPPRSSPPFLSS